MTFNWNVLQMDYTVSQDGFTNVVNTVHWNCSSSDSDGNYGSSYGAVSLQPPSGEFVEWSDITEEVAIGWVKGALGDDQVAATEAGIDAQIAEKANPTVSAGVPW